MTCWIFKIGDQDLYPDIPGQTYVYDNRHSIQVSASDVFLYLDKTKAYSFTGTGTVQKVIKRKPTPEESSRGSKINLVFSAQLSDVIFFNNPLSISPSTKTGRSNRAKLGIVNALGWARSLSKLSESMYDAILDLADAENLIPSAPEITKDFSVPDKWSKTKVRKKLKGFSDPVMQRSNYTCIVCGTTLASVLEAAHLSPYSMDMENRANPGNGVCLCVFCHRALDRRLIAIRTDGNLLVSPIIKDDAVALAHFSAISDKTRKSWLEGVDEKLLELTVRWFGENLSNRQ